MSRHEPSSSPTPTDWHVDADLLDRYATGMLDAAAEWSVEAHVSACGPCRRSLSAAAPSFDTSSVSSFDTVLAHVERSEPGSPDTQSAAAVPAPLAGGRLHTIWAEIEHDLDEPRLTTAERVMQRLGVPDHVARLLAATPSLTGAWIGAIAAVLAVTVLAAWTSRGRVPGIGAVGGDDGGLLLYLVTAPLLPLAGIAVAYGKNVDPTYEIGLAAPSRSGRVLLIRATAVLVVSLGLSALGTLALPSFGWAAVSWVLPALALTALALAVSSLFAPVYAATGTAVLWLSLVGYIEARSRVPLAAFQVHTQVVALLTLAGATAWIAAQRDRFELDRT